MGSRRLRFPLDSSYGALKTLAASLVSEQYSPNTIQSVLTTVKMVVASAVDENGNHLYPRQWNKKYIDAPPVDNEKRSPVISAAQIERALAGARPIIREFIATQAATGLRKGEVLALQVEDFDARAGLLHVSRTLSRHGETATKTKSGKRDVDLHPDVVAMLTAMLEGRTTGRLFDVTLDEIRWAYEKAGIKSHALRHFRYSRLQRFNLPAGILNFWIGHSVKGMAAIYGHVHEDIELRQRLVREVGLGFTLPTIVSLS